MRGLFTGLENGTLRPVVGKVLPLADAAHAHKEILEPERRVRSCLSADR
jgi:NADPH:quinone reductase-like Zn-dependent oxidoreductase